MDTRDEAQPIIRNIRAVSRREFLAGSAKLAAGGTLAAALAASGRHLTLAQASGAGADLTSLGLPELKLTVTDAGYQGVSKHVTAGRYLVTLDIQAKPYGGAAFLQLPTSLTWQAFEQMLAQAASPAGQNAPPAGYYKTYMAGGPGGRAGQTVQTAIDLKPGSYAVWADGPTAKQKPQPLTVTVTAPANPPTPEATVTIQEVNTAKAFAFDLVGSVKSGPQIVKVINDSDQRHFVELDKSPVPLAKAQLMQIVMLPPNAKPPAGLPSPDQIQAGAAAYFATQSPGATTWHTLNLSAGTYAMLCFVPDKTTGMPHAMEGMVNVVTIQ